MKKFALSLLLALSTILPARSEVSVSLNFFVDSLEPYGSWIDVEDYGYCWRPAVADEDPDWRPYTRGHWAYTEGGWTWISDEDFGWATYHYGRWIRIHSHWCWVPGYEWAPAWVSWRETDDALGWAPLPPEARWDFRIGFSSWTDGYYDVGPEAYCFVPRRFLGDRSLRAHVFNRGRNFALFDHSVNITRIVHRDNVVNNIFVGGPQPERIERAGGGRIERLRLRRDESWRERDWRQQGARGPGQRYGALSRIEGDELIVAAPKVDREAKVAPPRRVIERLGKETVDRGWRGLDPDERDRLRRSQRATAQKILPRELPERPQKPRTAWAAPSSPSGNVPEEVRKPVPTEPRDEAVGRRNPSATEVPRRPRPNSLPLEPQSGIQPQEKPIPPRGVRPDDATKPVLPAPPQPRSLPNQPPLEKERVSPGRRGRGPNVVPQVDTADRPIVPRNPSPRVTDDPPAKRKKGRSDPPAAAPAPQILPPQILPPQILPPQIPPPQVTPPQPMPSARSARPQATNPSQARPPRPAHAQAQSPRAQSPRAQSPRPSQAKASTPTPSPKRRSPSSDDDEKRKGKKH